MGKSMTPAESRKPKPNATFWKIVGAGASFQAGSSAVDSATIVASLVYHLTGSPLAVGAASAVLRLGWLLPQLIVGYFAERAERRMPLYMIGAFGRAGCLLLIAILLAFVGNSGSSWIGGLFLLIWTGYAFVSGIVAVPYNDIVGRSITSDLRSRMLGWRFFGGGLLALGVAAVIHRLLSTSGLLTAHAFIFAGAAALMLVSTLLFVSAGEPPLRANGTRSNSSFHQFLLGGWEVLSTDRRFRLFLFSQWLGGAALMALPFYVVSASSLGIGIEEVAILLGAQTTGSLASNYVWGQLGDRFGKLRLAQCVGFVRLGPPALALLLINTLGADAEMTLVGFCAVFAALGVLINGTTIGYLGYLMEISPDDRRPAYSAYFNALASPAALLPIVGAVIVEFSSFSAVFLAAFFAGLAQLLVLLSLSKSENI